MRAWRQNSFEKDPDRCFYHICPAPNAFPLLSKVYWSSRLILVAQTLPSQVRLLCLAQIEQQGTKKPLDCHLKIPIYKMHICAGPPRKTPISLCVCGSSRGVCTSWGPARTNHTSQPRRHFSLSLTDVCNMVAHIVEIIIVLRELHSHTLSGAE